MAGEGGMGVGTDSEGVAVWMWGSGAETVNEANKSHQHAGKPVCTEDTFRNKGANSTHANKHCGFLRERLEEGELRAFDT